MIDQINELIKDECNAIKIIESVGCEFTGSNGSIIKFKWDRSSENSTGILYLNSGLIIHWSDGERYGAINFVREKTGLDFGGAASHIKSTLGIDNIDKHGYQKRRLDNYLKRIVDSRAGIETNIDLSQYERVYSQLFVSDGISHCAQHVFNVRVTDDENRIIIPWYGDNGCVGTVGRINLQRHKDTSHPKYICIDKFNKGDYLFGMHQNRKSINDKGYVFIFESEKSVMKAFDIGFDNTVAVGCSGITIRQIEILKRNNVHSACIAFDEGSDMDNIIAQCKKLNDNGIIATYIIDNTKHGSKDSPVDNGRDRFYNLLNNMEVA